MARNAKKLLALVLCVAMLATMVVVSLPATADGTPARRTISVVGGVADSAAKAALAEELKMTLPLVNGVDVGDNGGDGNRTYDASTDTWSVTSIAGSIPKNAGAFYNRVDLKFKQTHDVSGYGYFSLDVFVPEGFVSAGGTSREQLRVHLAKDSADTLHRWTYDTSKLVVGQWNTLYFSMTEPSEGMANDAAQYASMNYLRFGVRYMDTENTSLYNSVWKIKNLTFYADYNEATGITRTPQAMIEAIRAKTNYSAAIAGRDVGGGNKGAYGAAMISNLASNRLSPSNVISAKAGDQIVFWMRADGAISSLKPYLMIDSGCSWEDVKADPKGELGGSIMRINMELPVGNDWQEVRVELPAETKGTKAYTVGADNYTVERALGSDEFNYAAINGLRIVSAGDDTYNTYFDAFHIAKVVALELDPGDNTTFTENDDASYGLSDLTVTAVYSDGHREVLANRDTGLASYTVDTSAVNYSVGGTYPVTVTYCGVTATFDITVNHIGGEGYAPSDKLLFAAPTKGGSNLTQATHATYCNRFPQHPDAIRGNDAVIKGGARNAYTTFDAVDTSDYDGIMVWVWFSAATGSWKDVATSICFEISSSGTYDNQESNWEWRPTDDSHVKLQDGLQLVKLYFNKIKSKNINGTTDFTKINYFGINDTWKSDNTVQVCVLCSAGYLFKDGEIGTRHHVCDECGQPYGDPVPCEVAATTNTRVYVTEAKTQVANVDREGTLDLNLNGYGDGTSGGYYVNGSTGTVVIYQKHGTAGTPFADLSGCKYLVVNVYAEQKVTGTATLEMELNKITAGGTVGPDQTTAKGNGFNEVQRSICSVKDLNAGWNKIVWTLSSAYDDIKDGINYVRIFKQGNTDAAAKMAIGAVYGIGENYGYEEDGHYTVTTDNMPICAPHTFTNWRAKPDGNMAAMCDMCEYATDCDHTADEYVESDTYAPADKLLFEGTGSDAVWRQYFPTGTQKVDAVNKSSGDLRSLQKGFPAVDATGYDGIKVWLYVSNPSAYSHLVFELTSSGTFDQQETNWEWTPTKTTQCSVTAGLNLVKLYFNKVGGKSADLTKINWLSVQDSYVGGVASDLAWSSAYLFKDGEEGTRRHICARCGAPYGESEPCEVPDAQTGGSKEYITDAKGKVLSENGTFDASNNAYGDGSGGVFYQNFAAGTGAAAIYQKAGTAGQSYADLTGYNNLVVNVYLDKAVPNSNANLKMELNSIASGSVKDNIPDEVEVSIGAAKYLHAGWNVLVVPLTADYDDIKGSINWFRIYQDNVLSSDSAVKIGIGAVFATNQVNKYLNNVYDETEHYVMATDGTTIIKTAHELGDQNNGISGCIYCGYTEACEHSGKTYTHTDRLDVPYQDLHGGTKGYVKLIKDVSFAQNSETPAEPALASGGTLDQHMEVSFTTADASQLSGHLFSFKYDGGAFSFYRQNQATAATSYECDILAKWWNKEYGWDSDSGADFTIGDKKLYLRVFVDMTQEEISASKARLRFQLTTSGEWNKGGRQWDVNLKTLMPGWQTVTLDLNNGAVYGNEQDTFDLSSIRLFRSVLWFDNSVSFKIGDVWAGDVHQGVCNDCQRKFDFEHCTYNGNGKCTVCGYERKDTEKEYDYKLYEENADLLYFTGSWTRVAYYVPTANGKQPKAAFSGKHASRAFSSTAQLDFAFFGTELNIGTYFNEGQGTLKITLDGKTESLALGATSEGNGGKLYFLDEGYHRVNIQLSGDGAAWIDNIQVKGGLTPLLDEDVIDLSKRYNTITIEAETEFVTAGSWQQLNYPKCSDGAALRIKAEDVTDGTDLQFTNVSGAEYLEVIGYKSKTHGKCQITIKAEGEEVALFDGVIDLSVGMESFGVDNDYQAVLVSQKVDPSKTYDVTVKPIAVEGHFFAMLLDCLKIYTAK